MKYQLWTFARWGGGLERRTGTAWHLKPSDISLTEGVFLFFIHFKKLRRECAFDEDCVDGVLYMCVTDMKAAGILNKPNIHRRFLQILCESEQHSWGPHLRCPGPDLPGDNRERQRLWGSYVNERNPFSTTRSFLCSVLFSWISKEHRHFSACSHFNSITHLWPAAQDTPVVCDTLSRPPAVF